MPYLYRSPLDREAAQPGAAPASAGAGSAGASSAPTATASAGGDAGTATSAGAPQAASGTYPGVMAYLNANKDNGAALASQAQSSIAGEVGAAQGDDASWRAGNQSALDSWKAGNDKAYQGYLGDQSQARTTAAMNAAKGLAPELNTRTTLDTGSQANDASPVIHTTPARDAYSAAYKGYQAPAFTPSAAPTLTPWNGSANATQARTDLAALGTDSGREAWLGQKNGGGAIPSGATQLDAALLGRGLAGTDLSGYGSVLSALGSAPTTPTTNYATPTVPGDWTAPEHLPAEAPSSIPTAPPPGDPDPKPGTKNTKKDPR